MSFYKEELAGETKNYIHLRAIAERRSTEDVLRELVGEVIESAKCMEALTMDNPKLAALWERYHQVSVSHAMIREQPFHSTGMTGLS